MPSNQEEDMETGSAIEELKDHNIDPHPDLGGRVRRSINRRSLAADSLDLSLNMLPRTVWAYLQSLFEALPGNNSHKED